jgi:hypothetical protein
MTQLTRLLHLWQTISTFAPLYAIGPLTLNSRRDDGQPSGTQAGQRISVHDSTVGTLRVTVAFGFASIILFPFL